MQKVLRRASRRVWNIAGEILHYRKPDLSRAGYVHAFPHQDVVDSVRQQLVKSRPLSNTTVGRTDYLNVAEGIVRFFAKHQRESGEIMDPIDNLEHQYSTPCFALVVAILNKHNRATDLTGRAWNALLAAVEAVSQNNAADNHGDFYLFNAVQALNILREMYPTDIRIAVIEARIRKVAPKDAYRYIHTPQRKHLHNWNAWICIKSRIYRHHSCWDTSYTRTAIESNTNGCSKHEYAVWQPIVSSGASSL